MAWAAAAVAAAQAGDRHRRAACDQYIEEIAFACASIWEPSDHDITRATAEPVDMPALDLLPAQMAAAACPQTPRSAGAPDISINAGR